jgi:hypothetical protein
MVPMRHWPACLLIALAVPACAGIGVAPAASPSPGDRSLAPDPCSGYTCSGPGAQLNGAYAYRLHTHCGVLSTWFDGRAFYVEAVDPSTITSGLDNPEDIGTMTLLSPHTAVFRASAGKMIRFADAFPGVIGEPYPFRVYVLSGGNQLIDRGFAGRLWQAEGSLPGVTGPSPGPKGQDALTLVEGTMTLISGDMAVFRDRAGGEVRFKLRGPVGCA